MQNRGVFKELERDQRCVRRIIAGLTRQPHRVILIEVRGRSIYMPDVAKLRAWSY